MDIMVSILLKKMPGLAVPRRFSFSVGNFFVRGLGAPVGVCVLSDIRVPAVQEIVEVDHLVLAVAAVVFSGGVVKIYALSVDPF